MNRGEAVIIGDMNIPDLNFDAVPEELLTDNTIDVPSNQVPLAPEDGG